MLADEVTRRESSSAALRARAAGLDPDMCFEHWDARTKISYDGAVFDELCSLRFVDPGHNVLIMGAVGVGKTFVAPPLGARGHPSALERNRHPHRRAAQAAAGQPAGQLPRRRELALT